MADLSAQTLRLTSEATSEDLRAALGVDRPSAALVIVGPGTLVDHPLRIEVDQEGAVGPSEVRAALRQNPTYVCIDRSLLLQPSLTTLMEQVRDTGHILVVIDSDSP